MIELLCIITNDKEDKIIKPLYDKYKMPFNITSYGEGTASSSMLEYFDLEDVKKYIYFSLINTTDRTTILNDIKSNLEFDKPGNGIGFTIPLSSSTKYVLDKFNDSEEDIMENKATIKDTNEQNKQYHLIVTIITEGLADNVMNTAKKAGAGGGTLIGGRSLYQSNSKRQFLGFSIEPEKDVVLIVAENKIKNDIMNAIVKENGLKTNGGGICFSMPISDAIGLYE